MAVAAQSQSCLMSDCIEGQIGGSPSTVRGSGLHVNAHPREPKIIYPCGKFIVIRDLENPARSFIYRGHNFPTTVAKFSPSGYWVASCDTSGKVRVWSWDHPEHLLKIEVSVFAGEVKDLDWDPESKRIVAVGDGQTLLAKVFMWDTGNSVGEMVGHSKRVTSVSYRPCRPFRIMTGAEDFRTCFYNGPPFALDHSNTNHTNWVNCVRFSPDGSRAVSVGTDKKIWLYDGKTGEPTNEVVNDHEGAILSVCWSPDNAKIATASADRSVKIFDVASLVCEHTIRFSDDVTRIGDMQQCVTWTTLGLISVSLSGDINFINHRASGFPERVQQGHQVSIICMSVNARDGRLITGSFDGVICGTELNRNCFGSKIMAAASMRTKQNIAGAAHGNKVSGLVLADGGRVVSVGWDDAVREARWPNDAQGEFVSDLATDGQPAAVGVSASGDVIVATNASVTVYRDGRQRSTVGRFAWSATSVAVCGNDEVAVGASDNNIYVFPLTDGNIGASRTVSGHRGAITALAYSPDGRHLAAGDTNHEVNVWIRGTSDAAVRGLWSFHTTRVTSVAWSPSGLHIASGSLDESIIVWSMENQRTRKQLPFAHKDGVTGVAFSAENKLISTGNDQVICLWNLR